MIYTQQIQVRMMKKVISNLVLKVETMLLTMQICILTVVIVPIISTQ